MKPSVKQDARMAAVLLACAIGLAACGSDNDNDGNPVAASPPPGAAAPPPGAAAPPPAASPNNSVPAGAGASVAAYIAYLRGLRTDETSAPVNVGSFVAPVDDTGAPTLLGT